MCKQQLHRVSAPPPITPAPPLAAAVKLVCHAVKNWANEDSNYVNMEKCSFISMSSVVSLTIIASLIGFLHIIYYLMRFCLLWLRASTSFLTLILPSESLVPIVTLSHAMNNMHKHNKASKLLRHGGLICVLQMSCQQNCTFLLSCVWFIVWRLRPVSQCRVFLSGANFR